MYRETHSRLLPYCAATFSLLLAACGDDAGSGDDACAVPGALRPCTCNDGVASWETCGADSRWGACECATDVPDAGADTGGTDASGSDASGSDVTDTGAFCPDCCFLGAEDCLASCDVPVCEGDLLERGEDCSDFVDADYAVCIEPYACSAERGICLAAAGTIGEGESCVDSLECDAGFRCQDGSCQRLLAVLAFGPGTPTDIPVDAEITIQFDAEIDPTSLAGVELASRYATIAGDQTVEGWGSWEVDGNTLRFRPTHGFVEFGTEYTVTIDGVMGTDGQQMVAPLEFEFRTVVVDPDYYYEIRNAETGQALTHDETTNEFGSREDILNNIHEAERVWGVEGVTIGDDDNASARWRFLPAGSSEGYAQLMPESGVRRDPADSRALSVPSAVGLGVLVSIEGAGEALNVWRLEETAGSSFCDTGCPRDTSPSPYYIRDELGNYLYRSSEPDARFGWTILTGPFNVENANMWHLINTGRRRVAEDVLADGGLPGLVARRFEENGHFYAFMRVPMTSWNSARTLATSLPFAEGSWMRADLASVSSQTEYDVIFGGLSSEDVVATFYVLGLIQDRSAADYSEPSGGWQWSDGTPVSGLGWSEGEPNDSGGNEDCMVVNIVGTVGGWTDVGCDWPGATGLFIEFQ